MRLRSIAALLAGALPAAAQDDRPLDGRAFAPADHTLAAFADVGALVESDLWDALERSPARMLLEKFRDTFGFGLDEIARFEAAVTFHPDAEHPLERQSAVIVLQGTERVGLGAVDRSSLGSTYELTRVGGMEVLKGHEPAIVSPRPGVLVFGDSHHVLAILEGRARGGVPAPDLMPLIAGGKALAWFAVLADDPRAEPQGPERSALAFAADWFDAADSLRHVALRLVQRPDDGRFVLTARAGFATGATGPGLLEKKIAEGVAAAEKDPRLRPLRPELGRLVTRTDGRELVMELDLGEESEAVDTLVQTVVLSLVPRMMAAERAAAEAAEVEMTRQRILEAQERANKAREGEKKK